MYETIPFCKNKYNIFIEEQTIFCFAHDEKVSIIGGTQLSIFFLRKRLMNDLLTRRNTVSVFHYRFLRKKKNLQSWRLSQRGQK